jgi:hypothetical protein
MRVNGVHSHELIANKNEIVEFTIISAGIPIPTIIKKTIISLKM